MKSSDENRRLQLDSEVEDSLVTTRELYIAVNVLVTND